MRIQLKSILYSALGLMTFFSASVLTSCKTDKCKATVCAYGGECTEDGACVCLAGYEGERCETISRDKFKGSWNVVEDGTRSEGNGYATAIQDGTQIDQVVIRNFYNNFNESVMATVKGDTIYIPSQVMHENGKQYTIEGKGYVDPEGYYGLHGKLIMRYRVLLEDGSYDDFGYKIGTPSEWTK